MSAAAPEPPAPTTSPEQGQRGTREPGPVLAQLSAALGNPDMKALEVKAGAALDGGAGVSTGSVPRCHKHGPCARTRGLDVRQTLGRGKEGEKLLSAEGGCPWGRYPEPKGTVLLPSLFQTERKHPNSFLPGQHAGGCPQLPLGDCRGHCG